MKANGAALTETNGVCTIANITSAETVTVEGVVLKSADYSAVDAAIAKIPADLSGCTDASVKALNDAKAAVVRGKPITEQAAVDAYAAAIENAVKGLAKKPAVTAAATSPQTGDAGRPALWIGLLLLSVSALAFTVKKRRKSN